MDKLAVENFLKERLKKIEDIKKESEVYQSLATSIEAINPPSIYLGEVDLPSNLMLHTCCAPCMIYPYNSLREKGLKLYLYFFNPNIHPREEWEKRAEGLRVYAEKYKIPYEIAGESEEEKWLNFRTKKKKQQCSLCYGIRFFNVAKRCAELGFSGFTTSLTISPYQNHEAIHKTATAAAKRFGVEYYPFDFKPGFYRSQELAKEENIYRQKYCGCLYSIGESFYAKKIAKTHGLDFTALPIREQG